MDKARLQVRQALIRQAANESVGRAITAYADGVMTKQAAAEYVALHIELAIVEWEHAEREPP